MQLVSIARSPFGWLWAVTAALAVVVALVLTAAPAEAAVAGPDQPEVNTVAVVDGGTLPLALASVLPPAWGPFDQPQLDDSTPARWSGVQLFWSWNQSPNWWDDFWEGVFAPIGPQPIDGAG